MKRKKTIIYHPIGSYRIVLIHCNAVAVAGKSLLVADAYVEGDDFRTIHRKIVTIPFSGLIDIIEPALL